MRIRLWRKHVEQAEKPQLIVIDGSTWQERIVLFEDELQVTDGTRSFPKKDTPRYYTEAGREVWLVHGPHETLIAAENLEEVRQSNVLRNVFAYSKPLPNVNYVIYIGLLLVLLVAVWRG